MGPSCLATDGGPLPRRTWLSGVSPMTNEKVQVHVLYYERYWLLDTVEDDAPAEAIQVYSFTSEQDAAEFERALGDDAWGWMRTCVFWDREEAVRHVEDSLARSAAVKQLPRRFVSSPVQMVVRERPAACRGGAPAPGKIKVFAVFGEDQTVLETFEDGGLDEAVKSYAFSTEEDLAEFLRALEFLRPWGEASCYRKLEDAVEDQEDMRGTPA